MATVYKAKCHVLNRFVAVKILREEFTTDIEFIKRFNIEAQAAASLTHPNIVSIYDVGNEGELYYIVMELIKGKTLKEIIVEDGSLPWKWSVDVAIQIASALEVAHKNNIIHRDIKPHNIIITEDGVAKVTDFGIAKAISNSTITAFGSTIGSVHYFSPEQAKGGYTDAKSDIYSLGVVMYEMVTGRVPFDADTPVSVALKHMQEQPVEPIKIKPTLPISVNNIIMKAMSKEPLDRYKTATEMLTDLRLALKTPDENFVINTNKGNDFPTQRVSIMTEEQKANSNKQKKQNKFITFFKEHKVIRFFTIFIGAILLFLLVMFVTFKILDANKLKDVQIVNIVGMTEEEARTELNKINVKLEIVEEAFDDEVPVGQIISQEPKFKENYTIKEQSTVRAVISKGKEVVPVPKLVGKTRDEALEELRELGLVPEEIQEESKTVEAGYVIRQEPAENEEVDAKSTVKIYVSSGIKKVKVPELFGKTEEEARTEITNAGLTLENVRDGEVTTKTNGTVIKQSIDSGTEVEEGTAITITVNKIAQIVNGSVTINLKSILGYEGDSGDSENENEENETSKPSDSTILRVTVTSAGTENKVYEETHKKSETKISVPVSGIGTITVNVFTDDILRKTVQMDLNATTTLTIQ